MLLKPSKIPHVIYRNGHPYFMIRVPADLVGKFQFRFIRKAIKSQNPADIKLLSEALATKAKSSFTLLRSGTLSQEQERALVLGYTRQREKPVKRQSTRLSDLYSLFYAEKSPGWAGRTPGEFNKQFENIIQVIGNRPAESYDRSDFLACREELSKRLAPKTVNKYMSLLSSVLRWAVKHDYIQRNPAEGLQLDLNRRADEERKAYDQADIKRILLNLPPKDGPEPFKFWIPMIAMYSGMRREEVCQLHTGDIRQFGEVWCFDINDSGEKSLKTKSSNRLIPIHSKLLEASFLEFVRAANCSGNLWGFTPWQGVWGREFGNWWSMRFNRRFITNDPAKVFHSLRHSVADTLKQQGVSESIAAALLGHEQGGITFNRYGKRYLAPRLKEAVEVISYG